jgi:hypothetical protein
MKNMVLHTQGATANDSVIQVNLSSDANKSQRGVQRGHDCVLELGEGCDHFPHLLWCRCVGRIDNIRA